MGDLENCSDLVSMFSRTPMYFLSARSADMAGFGKAFFMAANTLGSTVSLIIGTLKNL
jgi:hypothetical protein